MMRRLGQHFLVNKAVIRKIVDALKLSPEDMVIEIGGGHGELTKELGIRNKELRVFVIEKDRVLAKNLTSEVRQYCRTIEIIEGDALEILPSLIHNSSSIIRNYKIVGNIPFYITGRLLRILGDLQPKPQRIVLTAQKEVAERLCAKPPKMNLLAVSVQFWAEPEIIDVIPKKDFQPAPEVDAAVVKLGIRSKELGIRENYYKLVKILFKQPRKTILNNLVANYQLPLSKNETVEKLQQVGINPSDRPQSLSVEKICELTRVVYTNKQ